MSKIEDLEKRIAELESKLSPKPEAPEVPKWTPPSIDHTAHFAPMIKPTHHAPREGQSLAEANAEFRSATRGVGELTSLAEFLNKGPLPEPAPAEAVTVPIGPPPGTKYVDAIAKGFADRERAEELAKLVDVANKLRSR